MKDQKTFTVDVPDLGTFTFRHRTMRDQVRIGAEYSRLTDGVETVVPQIAMFADALATLKILTQKAPEGWDPEALDPLDDTSYEQLMRVYAGLRDKENTFRRAPGADGQGGGAGTSG